MKLPIGARYHFSLRQKPTWKVSWFGRSLRLSKILPLLLGIFNIHSGGSRGGAAGAPPKGPDSFVLTYKIFEM